VPSIEIKKTCAPNQERLYCYQKGKGKNVHVFCTSSSSDEWEEKNFPGPILLGLDEEFSVSVDMTSFMVCIAAIQKWAFPHQTIT